MHNEICPDCKGRKYKYARYCKPCSAKGDRNSRFGVKASVETRAKMSAKASRPKPNRRGDRHPMWKGDSASDQQGRARANTMHQKPNHCERCGLKKKLDWHHIDENTLNNNRSNLLALCRRCHQDVDGRMDFLKSRGAIEGRSMRRAEVERDSDTLFSKVEAITA